MDARPGACVLMFPPAHRSPPGAAKTQTPQACSIYRVLTIQTTSAPLVLNNATLVVYMGVRSELCNIAHLQVSVPSLVYGGGGTMSSCNDEPAANHRGSSCVRADIIGKMEC